MQVKSYLEGQIRTLGQNMEPLMAQLREEHLRPRGASLMDRGYYPDRAKPAPRGPFEIWLQILTGVRGRAKQSVLVSTTGQA